MVSNCGHDDWWIANVVCVRMTRDFSRVKVTATCVSRPLLFRGETRTASDPVRKSENRGRDSRLMVARPRPLFFLELSARVTLSLAILFSSREQEENLAGEIRDCIVCIGDFQGGPLSHDVIRFYWVVCSSWRDTGRSTVIFNEDKRTECLYACRERELQKYTRYAELLYSVFNLFSLDCGFSCKNLYFWKYNLETKGYFIFFFILLRMYSVEFYT